MNLITNHPNLVVLGIAFLSVAGQALLDRRHARRARIDKA